MLSRWLISARVDLAMFVGTAVAGLLMVALAPALAGDGGASPEWTWVTGVLMVDVAHVWSTAFVVYLDPVERRRRPVLYAVVPAAGYAVGFALYQAGEHVFWRALAYLAVFHFIRQQYGWVAMYRGRLGERGRLGGWIDGAAIYAATLYPLIVWHVELPRAFWWFRAGDFAAGLPAAIVSVAAIACAIIAVAYLGRAAIQAVAGEPINWGKHAVVVTTAACWYVGIVATDSDFAFTVTNVFIHGVPYLVLVYVYSRAAAAGSSRPGAGARIIAAGVIPFLATVWALAYAEELLWDRMVWHDRPWLFGDAPDRGWLAPVLVPLLAVPQLSHYVLDGFLWRRRSNPRLATLLRR